MIKVSVMYPSAGGAGFDMEYYLNKHVPMVKDLLGSELRGFYVDRGLAGAEPGSTPVYSGMAHLLFDSVEAFQNAFGPHAERIMGDAPNYTTARPAIQISEIKL